MASSMHRDATNAIGTSKCTLPAQVVTGAVATTDGADLLGAEGALIIVNVGSVTGTNSATLVIQDSSVGGTLAASYGTVAATDLTGGGTLTAFGTADSNTTIVRAYVGDNRYLRVAASAGVGAGAACSATIVPFFPRHK
jgi:hypothetical protein